VILKIYFFEDVKKFYNVASLQAFAVDEVEGKNEEVVVIKVEEVAAPEVAEPETRTELPVGKEEVAAKTEAEVEVEAKTELPVGKTEETEIEAKKEDEEIEAKTEAAPETRCQCYETLLLRC